MEDMCKIMMGKGTTGRGLPRPSVPAPEIKMSADNNMSSFSVEGLQATLTVEAGAPAPFSVADLGGECYLNNFARGAVSCDEQEEGGEIDEWDCLMWDDSVSVRVKRQRANNTAPLKQPRCTWDRKLWKSSWKRNLEIRKKALMPELRLRKQARLDRQTRAKRLQERAHNHDLCVMHERIKRHMKWELKYERAQRCTRRPSRRQARACAKRVRKIFQWENCSENSPEFRAAAQRIDGKLQRERTKRPSNDIICWAFVGPP